MKTEVVLQHANFLYSRQVTVKHQEDVLIFDDGIDVVELDKKQAIELRDFLNQLIID